MVAVAGATEQDAARLHELSPTAGVVPVSFSRAQLERWMDDVEQQLVTTGEIAGFLQMAPDGFHGVVRLVVDAPVPRLEAWAVDHLPAGLLLVDAGEAAVGRSETAERAFLGLTAYAVRALAAELGVPVRVLAPDDMFTADHRPDRVNAVLDAPEGRVARTWLG